MSQTFRGPDIQRILPVTMVLALICGFLPARASSLVTRQTGPASLVVTVQTDAPEVSAEGDLPAGFQRIRGGDLPLLQEPGRPALPYRTILVGLPEGRGIEVTAKSLSAVRVGAARLAPCVPRGAFGAEARFGEPGDGRLLARAELEDWEESGLREWTGPFPGPLAVVQQVGVLRDQTVAEVRVYPVQYSPADFEILHHPRIDVLIRFVSRPSGDAATLLPPAGRMDPEPGHAPPHLRVFDAMLREGLVNPGMIQDDRARRRRSLHAAAEAAPAPAATGSSPSTLTGSSGTVKLSVSQDGVYQVTPAMLTAAGIDPATVDPLTFHMTSGGADIPILVDGESDGSFDPTDRVIFFGTGMKNDRYTRTSIYYLSFNGAAGPRMTQRSGAFTGPAATPASFLTTVHAEANLRYTATVRAGVTEAWYWNLQAQSDPNSMSRNYPVSLPRVDPVAHTIGARARYLGLTFGNHTPRLLVNNTRIAENTFPGQILYVQSAAASSAALLSGANTLTVTLVSNGNSNDQVAVDYFEIDYRRTYAVDADQLLFDGEGAGTFHWALSNLGSSDLVLLDVTAPGAPQAVAVPAGQISAGPPFTASFEDTLSADRAYAISTRAGLRAPDAVTPDFASSLMSPANGADYIIITDRSLLAAMQPLADLRASQGLRVLVAATDDIYDEFNFGRTSPAAIRSFLTYAYTTWSQLPAPAYVLLAGDGHIDYTGNFGPAALASEMVPPTLRNINGLESPSDNDYAAVVGGDVLPEMFVGRLPIRSAADAATMIANIVAYETSPPVSALNQRSLYVADNDDSIFGAILDNLHLFAPATMAAAKAYLPGDPINAPPTQPQINATTDAVIAGFNAGSLLSTYLGHGNVPLWAAERILEHQPNPPSGATGRLDFNRLTHSGNQTFLLALNCINGYFVDLIPAGPGHVDFSLAEEALRRSSRGAVASWAPSALGQLTEYDSISYELFSHLFTEGMTTLGPATTAALVDAVNVFGVSTTNLSSMHFFGDPATRLALDRDVDGLVDYRETAAGSDPLDADSDDDGLQDGAEATAQGTSPTAADTDGDGIADGTELGVTAPGPGTDPNAPGFVPDADPNSVTDPLDADTDDGGVDDGAEDLDHNGRVDAGETDPNNPSDDLACPGPLTEVSNLTVTRSGDDIVLSWDPSAVTCATYEVLAAADAPYPKTSFAPFASIGGGASTSFTHVGAAAGGIAYDYLVRIVHPQLGPGPLGAYGQ